MNTLSIFHAELTFACCEKLIENQLIVQWTTNTSPPPAGGATLLKRVFMKGNNHTGSGIQTFYLHS